MRHETTIHLDPLKVVRELQRRGASARDVARATGISTTTLTGLIHHGRPITAATARKLGKWIEDTPVITAIADLLADETAA